jgi:hypothetical protein
LEEKAMELKSPAVSDDLSREETVGLICSVALELMYTGHEDEGWSFIEMAWNDETCNPSTLEEFRALLRQSPFFSEITTIKPPKEAIYFGLFGAFQKSKSRNID